METTFANLDDPYPSILSAILLSATDYPLFFYGTNALIFIILLTLSFLVSGSEVAFFSLSPDQVEQCKNSNSSSDKMISNLLEKPKRLLATILILNNLINIAIVTLSTIVIWNVTGTKDGSDFFVFLLQTVIVTILILFFGEVIPKNYALFNSLNFAKIMGKPLAWSATFLKPLSWSLMTLSNIIERRVEKKGYNVSIDELNHALDITKDDSTKEEQEILKGIVNFGTLSVKQVMTVRLDITCIATDSNFKELIKLIKETSFSRIPVYQDSIDKIEGILYVKDLLPHLDKDENFNWKELLRPTYFVPETKKIDVLLKEFQNKRVHMAIVVDEYGGTSGLITMEDILEEIVGEINDEFDIPEEEGYSKVNDNTFIFDAKTSLNDFCKLSNIDTETFEDVKGESESLGGLLLEINHVIPSAGTQIIYKEFTFTVINSDKKRLRKIKVNINR
ncbi:gliding motility-associated protein GldE [Aureibacter tunicatorum]|uniref:Gliding motility-associated protein GldE n=1 Tax=Aureibacter tunicatorum TaxID=866807 RepID=A0AAE3XJI0_9BACT|nr:gliding motility-associated protein GldE [Aureibacter tunicatorum]MDR6237105.1 gliding motility-associated protein GldE [Aureibacter tunicatorum]BDD06097.1 hypothetical protein AUTU_35800 [Aureibacter tunicatorum]